MSMLSVQCEQLCFKVLYRMDDIALTTVSSIVDRV